MTPLDIEEIKSRIDRAYSDVNHALGSGYLSEYQTTGTDSKTILKVLGLKSPKKLEDEFLALFIWIWSLKDYAKACLHAAGKNGKFIEDEVNLCPAFTYIADIANRAKHGLLRESRSGHFAKLEDVGYSIPQSSIKQMTFKGMEIEVDTQNQDSIRIHATICIDTGSRLDALEVIDEAMSFWEKRITPRIMSDQSGQ